MLLSKQSKYLIKQNTVTIFYFQYLPSCFLKLPLNFNFDPLQYWIPFRKKNKFQSKKDIFSKITIFKKPKCRCALRAVFNKIWSLKFMIWNLTNLLNESLFEFFVNNFQLVIDTSKGEQTWFSFVNLDFPFLHWRRFTARSLSKQVTFARDCRKIPLQVF